MKSETKSRKQIWAVVSVIALILVIGIIFFWYKFRIKHNYSELGAQNAANLDEFIKTQNQLLPQDKAGTMGLKKEDINSPVPTAIETKKITLVPQLMEGGDALYQPVVELPGNKFFVLTPSELKGFFKVDSPQDAIKYVDFIMVKLGKGGYDRMKKTVFVTGDYDKIGCKDLAKGVNLPLPLDRTATTAQSAQGGFDVQWIYYSPAYPSGYFKDSVFVSSDGNIVVKDKSDKPFWNCGTGFML